MYSSRISMGGRSGASDDGSVAHDGHGTGDLVGGIDRQRSLFRREMRDERENVLAEHLTGVEGHGGRHVHRTDDRRGAGLYGLPRERELAVATRLRGEIH